MFKSPLSASRRRPLYVILSTTTLALLACQQVEEPSQVAAPVTEASDNMPDIDLNGGRPSTPEEIQAAMGASDYQVEEPALSQNASLNKSAAGPVVTCTNGYNNIAGLGALSDHGSTTFILSPWYSEPCGNTGYKVRTAAFNLDHFHLMPEGANYCFGSGMNWGTPTSSGCINQSDAKYWPRVAYNMTGVTGLQIHGVNPGGENRPIDLYALRVKSGTAKVIVYKMNLGWFTWTNLAAGHRYIWSGNNTTLGVIRIFDNQYNGVFGVDNLEVGIY